MGVNVHEGAKSSGGKVVVVVASACRAVTDNYVNPLKIKMVKVENYSFWVHCGFVGGHVW